MERHGNDEIGARDQLAAGAHEPTAEGRRRLGPIAMLEG
jgi:hypothetical protein